MVYEDVSPLNITVNNILPVKVLEPKCHLVELRRAASQ